MQLFIIEIGLDWSVGTKEIFGFGVVILPLFADLFNNVLSSAQVVSVAWLGYYL
jgi:hypothetical protein